MSLKKSINCHCVEKDALIAWAITSINTNKKQMKKKSFQFFHTKPQFHR